MGGVLSPCLKRIGGFPLAISTLRQFPMAQRWMHQK
ncbi:hypothetical protein FOYG_11813 [Fusarium oxysporum NRRL 32931]|uniref:Uncharacterized protein n=1 Tax=Fusarium oxysporum NRRL 32931 TaxID=660029 RepID=W9HYF6_FUSOX|nr:hypothetical protein FOYG_11813 [Fusarium oxysporum NRRL 32931]